MSKIVVALISGGTSSERAVSLAGGDQIFSALDKNKYTVLRYDPQNDISRLIQDAGRIDTAFVNLHGRFGEDGSIQGLLDLLGIPYQCSGVLGSALAANKLISKRIYEQAALEVPPYFVIDKGRQDGLEEWLRRWAGKGEPVVVKPANGGSSIGMSIVSEAADLQPAIDAARVHDATVLVEAYIEGIELTGGVLGNEVIEPLPVVEIIPGKEFRFFDYTAKYTPGATREICPAEIDRKLTEKVQAYACRAHTALCCKGYSRTDMIARGDDLFVLETNTIPGMVPTSLLPLAAGTAGISFAELLDRLIAFSLEKTS